MIQPEVTRLSRRQFLIRLGAASATITVVGAGVSTLLNSASRPSVAGIPDAVQDPLATPEAEVAARALPNADDPVKPVQGTRPEITPVEEHYRIDIAAVPPVIDGESWVLPIAGLVDNPMEFTLDDLKNNFEPISQFITMECISNRVGGDLISTQYWTGASFRDVLAQVQPQENATHVKITCADGFDETVALDLIDSDPTITLNYYWDGQPLPTTYGFPLRVHIPNRFGMKQPKWITGMELIEGDDDGYWVRRGWSKDAFIKATSVIDTVGMDMMVGEEGAQQHIVPIGGIAYASQRGVSRVEVQVDDGEWAEAQLRAPVNNDVENYKTWRVWRYDWPYVEGQHEFRVRMFEEDGTPQEDRVSNVAPNGATGLHSMRTTV